MHVVLEDLIAQSEAGQINRRQLTAHIAAWTAAVAQAGAAPVQPAPGTFNSLGLNHLALTMTDLERSQRFLPESLQGRTYFRDPAGYKLQVGGPDAGGQRLGCEPLDLSSPCA